jgi:hypothetical protein
LIVLAAFDLFALIACWQLLPPFLSSLSKLPSPPNMTATAELKQPLPSFATNVPGLNEHFGEVGWWPNSDDTYKCSNNSDETLCLLLAHPAAAEVALKFNMRGSSALSLAMRHHRPDHLPADKYCSSSNTAAMLLLDYANPPQLQHMKTLCGHDLLQDAYEAKHGSVDTRTYARVNETYEICMGPFSFERWMAHKIQTDKLKARVAELEKRLSERDAPLSVSNITLQRRRRSIHSFIHSFIQRKKNTRAISHARLSLFA